MNVATFASCESSVDGTNAQARATSAKVRALSAKLGQAAQPLSIALKLIPEDKVEKYLKELPHEEFSVRHQRKLRDFTLSLEEENLITALGVDGHSSWSQMYNTISSTLTCQVGDKSMGVAQAAALLSSPDRSERLQAWNAIQAAWTVHEEAAASTLNSIIGWRLELNRKRAEKAAQPVHFLDTALHQNRMSRKTLDAMMQAVSEAQPLAQKALKLQAKVLGIESLHPADLFAPPPQGAQSSSLALQYEEGIDLIADCVSSVHPSVGEFVKMMSQKEWIEGKSGDKKAPGAYCTSFAKSRNPRVYLSSYTGSYQHVSTLAHELGHAFHSWVMKDMERSETRYPMNLAETASIFFETVVGDRLVAMAKTPEEKLRYSWYDAESAGAFLLNIPTRFDFESEIHAAREQGQNLTPDFLRNTMTKAWKGRYGDALSEYDSMFWASKLHFHMTGVQFYNFPYTFGYLFALGVYAQQEKLGDGFYQAYVDLLRDTGRMSAEEVVQKHLKCNIEEPEFWRGSIRIIEKKIEVLESLVNQVA
ncbi:hypothetical protein GUITHDRAFT_95868 [Guillardia theta CCMP2712]|uniref:Peptidase M3A/M3B catalytic domain-containing protein n=2 Tax=Guillardia theta TaxID=55529 RepID=L1J0A7_GUITC|nr:hypothetical protein GUITHDRAFT_95868 [Guillardia theta CCMP2712]EKX41926.1 hypothetical protein GUITHDRAFT_95868 [Guillardia theta CCMP2712]|eukprot:XP_005828906.1 hypothetical protein GUITHDRAFT_95868 [Guillardia theta CCMP2712]